MEKPVFQPNRGVETPSSVNTSIAEGVVEIAGRRFQATKSLLDDSVVVNLSYSSWADWYLYDESGTWYDLDDVIDCQSHEGLPKALTAQEMLNLVAQADVPLQVIPIYTNSQDPAADEATSHINNFKQPTQYTSATDLNQCPLPGENVKSSNVLPQSPNNDKGQGHGRSNPASQSPRQAGRLIGPFYSHQEACHLNQSQHLDPSHQIHKGKGNHDDSTPRANKSNGELQKTVFDLFIEQVQQRNARNDSVWGQTVQQCTSRMPLQSNISDMPAQFSTPGIPTQPITNGVINWSPEVASGSNSDRVASSITNSELADNSHYTWETFGSEIWDESWNELFEL